MTPSHYNEISLNYIILYNVISIVIPTTLHYNVC